MTFIHCFTRRLSCTVTVADDPPASGEIFIQNVEWTGCPKQEHAGEYIRWSHTVYAHLSNHWNLRLMQVIQTDPDRGEIWAYTPREEPKRFKGDDLSHLELASGGFGSAGTRREVKA